VIRATENLQMMRAKVFGPITAANMMMKRWIATMLF
jgi:hypothetical protein